jgi:arylsulfatase
LNGKKFRVHLDGYNFVPDLKGESDKGPRDRIMYFDQGGNLNAIRWTDWKVSFAVNEGNIATSTRDVTGWSQITNLRMDPYERAIEDGGGYWDWYARQMWILVPIQGVIKDFFSDFTDYPYQTGSSLNAGGINYGMLKQEAALKQLKELESLKPR